MARPRKFDDDRASITIRFSRTQRDEIDSSCRLILVEGDRGKPRPMTVNEFAREAARLLSQQLRAGAYRPTKDRHDEARIVEVLAAQEEATG